jgi:hypothetical protein
MGQSRCDIGGPHEALAQGGGWGPDPAMTIGEERGRASGWRACMAITGGAGLGRGTRVLRACGK